MPRLFFFRVVCNCKVGEETRERKMQKKRKAEKAEEEKK